EIRSAAGDNRSPEQVAEGFLKIAVDNMANAIKRISVQRGYDVTQYTLCCFGGAGGQHACLVADALGMKRIFIHPYAGVLSAYGMGLADIRAMRERTIELRFDEAFGDVLTGAFEDIERAASEEVLEQGIDPGHIDVERRVHVRYEGTDSALAVKFGERDVVERRFAATHRDRFGFVMEN
ncbi:MAG: hypothetical protein GWO21_18120, partial [Gammaproteobacteria bacterium]|nr:hypothetical protein [Gammaproteobacteria bacterium]